MSVALNEVDGYTVSTVFLGINMSLKSNKPEIYETMVFRSNGPDEHDLTIRRYATRKEALKGHLEMLSQVQQRQKTA